MKRALVFVLMLAATSNTAMADGYYGVNISAVTLARGLLSLTGVAVNASQGNALGVLAGYRVNPYLAGEVGVTCYDGLNAENRFLSLAWTANLVGTLPVAQDYSVYAKVGIAKASPGIYGVTMDASGQNVGGRTYGFGLDVAGGNYNEHLRIGVDHVPMGRFANGRQTDTSYQISVILPY